jgi:hypothetical protein
VVFSASGLSDDNENLSSALRGNVYWVHFLHLIQENAKKNYLQEDQGKRLSTDQLKGGNWVIRIQTGQRSRWTVSRVVRWIRVDGLDRRVCLNGSWLEMKNGIGLERERNNP